MTIFSDIISNLVWSIRSAVFPDAKAMRRRRICLRIGNRFVRGKKPCLRLVENGFQLFKVLEQLFEIQVSLGIQRKYIRPEVQ